MNLVTFAEVTEVTGTPYHNPPKYYEADILQLKNSQIGIASIEQILIQYNGDTRNVLAVIGKDSSGNIMKETSHGVVLPCPPYCGKDGSNLTKFPTESILLNFEEALGRF